MVSQEVISLGTVEMKLDILLGSALDAEEWSVSLLDAAIPVDTVPWVDGWRIRRKT
jgi:hypothetical protein